MSLVAMKVPERGGAFAGRGSGEVEPRGEGEGGDVKG